VIRDISNWITLLRALSSLSLNDSRDEASPTSLGNLCQGFITLIVKIFFLISSLNLPFHFKAVTPSSVAMGPAKMFVPIFLISPLQALADALRSPHSFLFRLNSPSSPSLSSQQRGSSPRIIAGASFGPAPGLSCAEGSRAGHRTPGGGSHQSGAEGQNPLPCPAAYATGDQF